MKDLRSKQLSAQLLCHFIIIALMFPLYQSGVWIWSSGSPNYILTHYFALRIIMATCFERNMDWKKISILGYAILFFLVCFNVFAFYANRTYHHWYTSQINMTIAFVFFLMLLFSKDSADIKSEVVARFILYAVSIIAGISLIPGLLGYMNVRVSLTAIELVPIIEWDPNYCWVYGHKSEYSFLLVLCIALSVVYRNLYTHKWHFWASLGAYAVGLVLADTRATQFTSLLIFAGVFLDYLNVKVGGFKWKHLLLVVPFVIIGTIALLIITKDRNLSTLGGRFPIWIGCIKQIWDNPWGVGPMLGTSTFFVENHINEVSNGHNVFLNAMMQFSLPAGFFFIPMTVSIAVAAIKKNLSFRTFGIIAALFIPLNMDWCIVIGQVPLVLLMLYFIFFHPLRDSLVPKR